jgi:hypothetical protein
MDEIPRVLGILSGFMDCSAWTLEWVLFFFGDVIRNTYNKSFEKNFKKPLDKIKSLWYNIDTEMRKGRPKRLPTRASKTFPPKTSHRKVCRFAVYKCEPEPQGWSNVGLCRLQSQKFFQKKIWKNPWQMAQGVI